MRLCLYRGGSAGLGGGREKGRGTVGPFLLGCEVGQAVCCLKLQKNGKESTCHRQLLEGHISYRL